MRHHVFTRLGLKVIFIAFIFAVGLPEAAALEYRRIPLKFPDVAILARGTIVPGDLEQLAEFSRRNTAADNVTELVINSPGGNVPEAARLGNLITKYKLSVFVPSDGQCVSACFILFAAASGRFVAPGAVIGVHRVSLPNGRETDMSLALTRDMAGYLAREGIPSAILQKLVTTPPGQTAWLTASDFASMGVRFIDDPRWR